MNLREIHAHVDIRRQDAEDWLAIMDKTMSDTCIAVELRRKLHTTFHRAAMMLVNVVE
jgi:hemoglobin